MGVGIGLLVSWGTKKITEAAQRVQNVATKSKEAADAAQSTTSSLKDLVSAYEELGDKSGWDTEDFDQAKDIQAEILDLAKEQGTLDENKLSKLNLQNGKYEEQLGLLQDITAEQLEASRYELTQNKDAQGDKLVDTAKKNNRTHYLTVWSAPEMDMGDQIKNAGIDVFNKFGGYGPDKLNDADSIVDYYNEVGKALKYVIDNTTEAERAAGGTYHSLYQFLLDEQSALRDDVDSYNDSTDAINNNTNARRKLQAVDFWQNDNNNSMDVSFTFDKVNSAIQTLENTIDGFDASKLNELLWGKNEGLSDEQAQALANLRKALTDMDFSADTNGVNAFIQALVQVGIVAQSSANGVDAVAQASQKMEDISSKIDEIQTAYKNTTTAIEEYNKYGYLSADTLQTLLNEDFEYLSCLELVDGQLQVNTEKYQGMIAAQYQSAAMALVEKANAELAKIAQGEKKDAVEDATKATEDQATALTERVCPALGEFAKASMTAAAAQEFLANGDAAWSVDPERTKEVYAGLASGLDILDATVNQIMGNSDKFRQHMNGFDKETKNRNKNTTKSVTDVASAFDTLNKAMKEYNQYGYLCADTAKTLVGLDDKFTACLTKQGDKLQINVEQFRKFVKEQLKEANAAKDGGKSADEMNKILNYLDQNVDTTAISFEQLTDAIKGYGTAMDEAKEKTDAIKSAFSGLSEVSKNKIDNPFGALDAEDVGKKYQAIRDLYDNTDLFTDDRFAEALNPETGLVDYDSDAFKQMFLEKLDGMATACEETGGKAGKYLAQGFRDAEDKIKNNVISIEEYINGIGSTLENINSRMDNFQSAFNDLSDIVDEYNAYGDLSQDSIQKLMTLDTKYVGCLELQGDKLVFNKEAFKELYIAELKELALKYKGTEIGKRYADILQKVADGTWDVTDHMKGMGTEAQNLQTIFSNLKDLFSSLLDVFNKFNDNNSNDLKIWGDAMTEEIDKRIEALQDANDEQEKAIELAKLQAELEKAETQKTVRVYTSNGYEWQADESAIKEARDNLNSKQRENALNDEIDKLNKLKDKYTELINLIGSSYEDYQKKQEYAAKIQGMTFDQMTAGLDGYKDNVIANMKAIQGATNVNNVVTNLTNLVNTLVKLNDVLSGLSTGTTQSGGITGLFNRIKNMFSSFGNKSSGKGFLGRLSDAGKSILGIGDGSASSKLTADIAPIIKSGVGDSITTGLDAAKPSIAKSAQGIFSGNGGLKSIFQKGFSGVASIAQKAVGGLGSIFGDIGTTLGGTKLFSGIAGIFKGIGTTVSTVIGTAGGTGIAGTIAAAVSHIPVIGTILLGGTLAVGAIGGGSLTTGIKRIGSSIANVVKGIGSTITKAVKGVGSFISKLMPWNWGKSSSDSGSKKKGIGSWKIWPWNWGRAKGDKHIDQAAPYNVDEEGEEIIVRNPAKGRMTYLEKGDGVIPADTTENLMEIGKDPKKWLSEAMKESGNSVDSLPIDDLPIDDLKNAKTKGDLISITKSLANNQMKRLRDKFDTVWKRLGKNAGLSEEQIDTIGSTIFDRMNSMISNSMDSALGNKNLTDDQIKTICAEMFQRMGSVYKNGWDNLYSLSPDMSTDASTAINKLFETIFADYNADTSNISDVISGWLPKVENTMNTTPASGLSGGGGYYGNSMDANIGPSASFSFSKIKETIQGLFEKFSNSKLGAWLN